MTDLINHPPHYQGKRYECIDLIERVGLSYHLGNAVKYVVRHKQKGGRDDIEKAIWYVKRLRANDALILQARYVIKVGEPLHENGAAIAENFDFSWIALAHFFQRVVQFVDEPNTTLMEQHLQLDQATNALQSYLRNAYDYPG